MSYIKAQATAEPSERTGKVSEDDTMNAAPFGRRIFSLRNIGSILLTLGVLYLVYRELLGLDWREVWTSVRGANTGLFMLAFTVFYCSFAVRGLRWKALLTNVGYDHATRYGMPSAVGLTRIMYLAWFANCLTVGRLGDVYRGYLLKKEAGVSFTLTLGTVVAERLLDLMVLVAMMGAGLLIVFHGSLPAEATQALAAGLVLATVAVLGLLSMRRLRGTIQRVLPKRLHAHYARLEHGIVGSFRRRLPLLFVYSAIGWAIEGATVYLTAAAVGTPVSLTSAIVVALAASLLTVVPITPSGLGFTEAGMVIMLQWLGLDVSTATAATLLFRVINYWSIVVFGFLLYVFGHNTNQLNKERLGTLGAPVRIYRFFTGHS